MTPSQRRFTVFAVTLSVALLLFLAYEGITGSTDWVAALIFALVFVLVGSIKYGYWMMVLEERDRKKAEKKSGQIPT